MNHLIKKIYETLDTKIKFHIPNETSVEGRELTYGWIYHNNYPDLPDDWDWSWVISKGRCCLFAYHVSNMPLRKVISAFYSSIKF